MARFGMASDTEVRPDGPNVGTATSFVVNVVGTPFLVKFRGKGPFYGTNPSEALTASKLDRVNNVSLLMSYWAAKVKPLGADNIISTPCQWCGDPTGCWCEWCLVYTPGEAHHVCKSCNLEIWCCSLCNNKRIISGQKLHNVPDSSYGNTWSGAYGKKSGSEVESLLRMWRRSLLRRGVSIGRPS